MSDGLKLVSSVITTNAPAALREIDRDWLVGNEQTAFDFVASFHRRYGELPEAATVREETGIQLPRATEPIAFYLGNVDDRNLFNQVRRP